MSSIPDVSKVNYNGVLYNVKDAVTRGKMDEVETARQQAIQDIQAEGQTQTGAVTAEGTRVLGTIPNDYTALAGDVGDLKSALINLGDPPNVADTDAENVDLDITDDDGYVLMRLADGHIQTKNFNSKTKEIAVKPTNATNGTFDIVDQSGNVALRLEEGQVKTQNFDSTGIQPIIVTVKKDGSGDFTTIRAAVDSITDASSALKPYVIEVYPGTYNVFDDYTQAEIETAGEGSYIQDGSGFVGILLNDGISMRGIGSRDEIVLHGELDPEIYSAAMRNNISTLNLKGTLTLENITVTGKYIRYCVHDDFYTEMLYVNRVVKNCVFRGELLTSGSNTTTWGEGSLQGKTTICEDCDFGTTMLWHSANLAAAVRPSVLIVKNCIALYASLYCYNHAIMNNVHFYNNHFTIVNIGFQNGSSSNKMMKLDGTDRREMIAADPAWNYVSGEIERFPKSGLFTMQAGQLVVPNTPYWGEGSLDTTDDPSTAYGVVIGSDSDWIYVQTGGYIMAERLGLSGLTVGDKITADDSGILEKNGSGKTFGVVTYIMNENKSFVRRV